VFEGLLHKSHSRVTEYIGLYYVAIQSLYGSNSLAEAIATPTGVRRWRIRTESETEVRTSSRRL